MFNFHRFFARCFQILLVLIPSLEGTLGVINDIEGKADTMTTIITPLLSMNNVQAQFLHSWRAITNPSLQSLAYYGMFCLEGIVGLLGIISLIKMLINFKSGQAQFVLAQAWGRAACCLGVAVWGLGFFVLGGDFFLAWQNPNISYLQSGGLYYALMMFIPYVLMKAYQQSDY